MLHINNPPQFNLNYFLRSYQMRNTYLIILNTWMVYDYSTVTVYDHNQVYTYYINTARTPSAYLLCMFMLLYKFSNICYSSNSSTGQT